MTNKLIEAMALVLRDADHGCDWEAYVGDAQAVLKAISDTGYAVVDNEELADLYIAASGKRAHASDCATSAAPANRPGPCDCAATTTTEES